MPHRVSTVIVNFRTPDLTLEAVRSVIDDEETREVVVVENGSGDDSAARLRAFEHPRYRLVVSEQNLGFGGGNNLGARESLGEFLFLLNSDATADPGCLASLREACERSGAMVGPRVLRPDREDQAMAAGSFPTFWNVVRGRQYACDPDRPEWITGAAMLVRREDFLAVGGFDERYFMYLEDVKLCWDLAKRGVPCLRVPSATVVHLNEGSMTSSKSKGRQYHESRDRFMRDRGLSTAQVRVMAFLTIWRLRARRVLGLSYK